MAVAVAAGSSKTTTPASMGGVVAVAAAGVLWPWYVNDYGEEGLQHVRLSRLENGTMPTYDAVPAVPRVYGVGFIHVQAGRPGRIRRAALGWW